MIKITPYTLKTKAAYNQAMANLLEHSTRDYRNLQKATANTAVNTPAVSGKMPTYAEGLKNFFENGWMNFGLKK